jgi:hypothetical protein
VSSVFFTDRDLGKSVPALLREAGISVERHDDHFSATTTDEEWLSEIGRRGWFALTHNRRIRYQPNERDAVMGAGVGLFVLVGKVPHQELGENFIATVGRVEDFITRNSPPFIAKIYRPPHPMTRKGRRRPGRVVLWLSYEWWRQSRQP